jgi:hypothetical protein
MSGSADVTSGVQKKYLTVKSGDFNLNTEADDYTYLDLEFPEPLQHVHEIALQSATIPNEFFNVRQGQNTLTIGWITQDVPTTQSNAFTVEVVPGLYTLDNLCTALNTQIQAQADQLLWTPGNTANGIQFSRPDSSFATDYEVTQIEQVEKKTFTPNNAAGSNLDGRAYYALVHVATPQAPFATSLAARLGFTRHDVFVMYESPRTSGTAAAGNRLWENRPDSFDLATIDEMVARGNTSVFEHNTDVVGVDASAHITKAMLSGSETYDNLLLHCDLLSNSTLMTTHLDTGHQPAVATIQRSDVLAVVPNNANIGSNIVFVRPSEHYGGHAINQHRPITKMRLWITDSAGKPFRQYEMPDYVAVLEFTIVEHVPDIMRQVAQLNQNKAYQSRHMPMALG